MEVWEKRRKNLRVGEAMCSMFVFLFLFVFVCIASFLASFWFSCGNLCRLCLWSAMLRMPGARLAGVCHRGNYVFVYVSCAAHGCFLGGKKNRKKK